MPNHEETADTQKDSNLNRNLRFSKKHRALHLDRRDLCTGYRLGRDKLHKSPAGKGLGTMLGTRLNMN